MAHAWQLSVQLLRDMGERGLLPTASAHLAALWACARAGQWPTAFQLLEEMELYGLPNILGAFTAAASACARRPPCSKKAAPRPCTACRRGKGF